MVWLYNGYTNGLTILNGYTNGLTIEWLHEWFDYIMLTLTVWIYNGYTVVWLYNCSTYGLNIYW